MAEKVIDTTDDTIRTRQNTVSNAESDAIRTEMIRIGENARQAEITLRNLDIEQKNRALLEAAEALVRHSDRILSANEEDVALAKKNGMPQGMVDRLMLTDSRIEAMAEGLRQIASLDDPIGEVTGMKKRPNGLLIGQKRVPLGVVGIIYESRPNVTADAFGLCFKTGNAVILKGGKDAFHSNQAIVAVIGEALTACGLPSFAVQADTVHGPSCHGTIYEDESLCGCSDTKGRCRADQSGGSEQHHPGDRDRHRKLSYLCGRVR